jgi:hypothetical protein
VAFALLPDADDIAQWSSRVEATTQLPRLVRRLIAHTCESTRLAGRAGAGTRYGGWDLTAEVLTGNQWVPSGTSYWEVGTDANSTRKANSDYLKRTAEVDPAVRAGATFVFVTSRRWAGCATWADEQRAEAQWMDVQAIDADGLEAWLEEAPGVHLWLSEIINGRVRGAKSLEEHWRKWSEATTPPVPRALLSAGREVSVAQVADWVAGAPAVRTLGAPSTAEAIAFIAAALDTDDPEVNSVLGRAVVISDPDAWDQAVTCHRSLILIPTYAGADASAAVRAGHLVIVPLGPDPYAVPQATLADLDWDAAVAIFKGLGMDAELSEKRARAARRNLQALRRQMATAVPLARPPWGEPAAAREIIPALLAGGWDQVVEADRGVLATLADQATYAVVEERLLGWAVSEDPPVRVRGTVWTIANLEDAWTVLGRLVTTADWDRYQQVALEVLSAPDPALRLAPDERWMATVHGAERPHSSVLRKGIAETIAMLSGWPGLATLHGGRSGPELASHLVGGLMVDVNNDAGGGGWASLGDVLPFLAEGSPSAFLEAVRRGAIGEGPLHHLLIDAEGGGIFGRASHAGVLWALETLAWSADYIDQVATVLAQWAASDPGGQWGNRPGATFRSLFLSWYPQTSASLPRRLAALDAVRTRLPAESWPLLLGLLTRRGDTASPNARPKWHDWDPPGDVRVTRAGREAMDEAIGERLVEDAAGALPRLAQLVQAIDGLTLGAQRDLIAAIRRVAPDDGDRQGLVELVDALRVAVGSHRAFHEADWALPPERVEELEAEWRRLLPVDPIERTSWLFGAHPSMEHIIGLDHPRYEATVAAARTDALQDVLDQAGTEGLEALIAKASDPWVVGVTLGRSRLDQEGWVLDRIGHPGHAVQMVVRGYLRGRSDDLPWLRATLTVAQEELGPATAGELLAAASDREGVWELARDLGAEAEHAYWSSWRGHPAGPMREIAAEKLIGAGRPYEAVDLLAASLPTKGEPFATTLAMQALREASASAPPAQGNALSMFRHELPRLLARLEADGVDRRELAQIEWVYLPLLEDTDTPLLLHRAMATDPEFFIEVLSTAFRADDEEPRELDEGGLARARRAFDLLGSWKQPPGTAAGVVDPDALRAWYRSAAGGLQQVKREAIGQQRIGHVLRYTPPGEDGVWPPEAVRDLLEAAQNRDLELGLAIEVANSRGVTTRGPFDGGEQERDLAQRYREDAERLSPRWSRTASLLQSIAQSYEVEGRRWDLEAAQDADQRGV